MNKETKPLTIQEAFDLIKNLNEKMQDVDGLSMIPHLTLEITNTGCGGREFEGRILFMGEPLWDSIEDSNNPSEVREIIAEEILENERNLALIAGQIKALVGKRKW